MVWPKDKQIKKALACVDLFLFSQHGSLGSRAARGNAATRDEMPGEVSTDAMSPCFPNCL